MLSPPRALLATGSVVLVLVAALVGRAIGAARQAEAQRLTVVAERVFDELERSLDAWLEVEEARPFYHWNHQYAVDNDQGLLVSQRSPLAQPPQRSTVLGYFQRDPAGRLATPYSTPSGQPRVPGGATIEQALARVLATDEPGADVPWRNPEQAGAPILQQLNKGLQQKVRAPRAQQANAMQINNFIEQGALVEVPAVGDQDVPVAPFEVRLTDGHIVLERDVDLDGAAWTQGLVLHRDAFLEQLQADALGAVPGVSVDWGSTRGPFAHRFREPFDGLTATLTLPPLPGVAPATISALLGAGLVVVLFGAVVLIWRWIEASARVARQRTDFVAAVTHELRSPLTSIRMYAEMLEADMAPPEARAGYLATIRGEAERLGNLVEGVLTFARLERGGVVDSPSRSLAEIADAVRRVLEPLAGERGLDLEIDLGNAGGRSLPEAAMHQILHNLVDNAIKFGVPPGTVWLRADLAEHLTIEVANPGPPLRPELVGRMFEAFERGERELTRTTRGTGIGLAVVEGLTRELGGSVTVRCDGGEVVVGLVLPN